MRFCFVNAQEKATTKYEYRYEFKHSYELNQFHVHDVPLIFETENIFESKMDFDEEDLGIMIENPRPKTSGRDRGEGFGNRPSTG